MDVKLIIKFLLFVLFSLFSLKYLQVPLSNYFLIYYIIYLLVFFATIIISVKGNNMLSLPPKSIIIVIFIYLIWKLIVLSYSPFFVQGIRNIFDFIVFITLSFFIIPNWLNRKEFLKIIYINLLLTCLLSVIIGSIFTETKVYYRYTDSGVETRYAWLFTHPNTAGLYGMSLFLVSFLLFSMQKKIVYLISALLGVTLPFFSLSRTTLVGSFMFLFLCFFVKLTNLKLFRNRYIKALTYLIIYTLLFLIVIKNLDVLSYEKINLLLSSRLDIWNVIIKSMDNILIGEGLFLPGVNLVYSVEKDGFGIDGLFVNILYDEGIIGLLINIILFLVLFYTIYRKNNDISKVTNYLLLIALMYSITETHFFINNIFTIFILGTLSFSFQKYTQIKF